MKSSDETGGSTAAPTARATGASAGAAAESPADGRRGSAWWPALAIPLLAILVYLPGLRNDYVYWDDTRYIRDNPLLSRPDGLERIWLSFDTPQYYPLTFTTYWIEYQIWGAWPAGYYVTNVLLHALNSLLVCLVARGLGASRPVAWVVAALFAVHPIQVASVAWLAQRKNLLSAAFALWTILAYLRYRRTGESAAYVLGLLTFAAALLAKTSVVTLPLSVLVADVCILRESWRRSAIRMAPLLALAIAIGAVTILVEQRIAPDLSGAWTNVLHAAGAVWFYILKLIWPHPLMALYPRWDAIGVGWWLLAWVALAVALRGLWPAMQRDARMLWGTAHFLLMLLPALGFIPFGLLRSSPVGDHLAYLASIGFFLVGATSIERWSVRAAAPTGRRAIAVVPALVVLLALSAKTCAQVDVWRDGRTLWSHTLEYNSESALAHNNLGVAVAAAGELDSALLEYRTAARLDPSAGDAAMNVGVALRDLGRRDEALAEFRRMGAESPLNPVVHYNLARTLAETGDTAAAAAEYAEAVRLRPHYVEAIVNWGVALVESGDVDGGIRRFEDALRVAPGNGAAHFNLALALANQGRHKEAVPHYLEALRVDPENAQLYTNLGLALAAQGNFAESADYLTTALRLNPEDYLANLYLGTLLAQHGQLAASAPYLAAAVRLRPDQSTPRFMLGFVAAGLGDTAAARQHYERAIELDPRDIEVRLALSDLLEKGGLRDEAADVARKAAETARASGNEALARQIEARMADRESSTTAPVETNPTTTESPAR